MASVTVKTWALSDIERAVDRSIDPCACPQCELESRPQTISRVGDWRLAVGARDVTLTVPVSCSRAGHRFLLIISLWHGAKTPALGIRVRNKIGLIVKQAQQPAVGG